MEHQDIEAELKQEFTRFIEFGNLLDRKMRIYLIQYLQNKFNRQTPTFPDLNDRYFDYLKTALDQIFLIPGLLDLSQQNEKIRRQVILDTLYWIRKTYQKVKIKAPYKEEEERLQGWAITPLKIFVKRWAALPQYLREVYTREQLDSFFFKDRFNQLINNHSLEAIPKANQVQIETLLHDILAQWDALLYAKILDFQLRKFSEAQEGYLDFLQQKVEEYNRLHQLLSPFTTYFGWDLSRKLWQATSFDILQHYDQLLQNEPSVKALADLLGSMREAEIEIEEETIEKTIIRQQWVIDETARSEIVGIRESDDLTNMLSSEALLLSDEHTEELFLKKYADKKLLTFRYEDRKLVQSKDHFVEINQRVNQKEKGPFIVCIDSSESMEGRPEEIAKVLTMGILKMAMHQNRRAYLINFSIGIKTLDLYDIANSIDEIAAFLQMSFYGGTDATLALHEALRQLEGNAYEDADILMVSDFIMHKLDKDLLQQISYYRQNKGTQFHCLTLGSQANPEIIRHFDTNWVYDPKEKGIIRSLTQGLKSIKERY